VLAAIFAIIPYLGTLLVAGCAALITLASDPSLVLWVIIVFVVVQQIEGNIILPLLMKGQVELPEMPLLIFILFLGSWLGIVGVFLAPPLFAILRVLYLELYLPRVANENSRWKKSALARGENEFPN
jgi:predicted PurR-regulated permease PerM